MNKILFINKSSRLPSIIIMSVSLLWIFAVMLNAQDQELWNNKRCAVSLTYDDALNVHLDIVQPALDSLGFKGTFYIPISFPGFRERLQDWKKLAANGNELGNHTLFHPCAGSYPGRDWVQPDYDLDGYTMKRFIDEVEVANTTLRAIDGRRTRTFAYTCGDTMIGDSSFVPKIKKYFAGARSVTPMMQKPDEVDLFYIGSYMIDGQSGDELIALVKQAMQKEALLVFLFHGVGGEHSINVSAEAHSKLLHFLKENEKNIWVAPLVDIAGYISDYNNR